MLFGKRLSSFSDNIPATRNHPAGGVITNESQSTGALSSAKAMPPNRSEHKTPATTNPRFIFKPLSIRLQTNKTAPISYYATRPTVNVFTHRQRTCAPPCTARLLFVVDGRRGAPIRRRLRYCPPCGAGQYASQLRLFRPTGSIRLRLCAGAQSPRPQRPRLDPPMAR